jgi:hypothetical protein
MRKIFFCFLLCAACNINAFEKFDIKFNIGNLGYAVNIAQSGSTGESFFELLNIGIEQKGTRIGIEYSPMKFWDWNFQRYYRSNTETISFSFLNFNLYWNTFDIGLFDDFIKFYCGPFSKINYMHLSEHNIFTWNTFIFSAGLRFGFALNLGNNVYYHLFGGEIGYRNISGENAFYVSVNIDIIVYLASLISS